MNRLCLCLLPMLLVLGSPRGGRADELTDRVDKVFARWDTKTTPGCAIGVVRDGKLIYQKAYGLADLEQGTPHRSRHRLPHRVRLEAVHRVRHPASGEGRQAVAGRRRPQTPAGDARLRQDDHHSASAPAHQRPARSVEPVDARGLADERRHHRRRHLSPRLPAAGVELQAGGTAPLQQHGVHAGRAGRRARFGSVVPGILPEAHLRAARDDEHALREPTTRRSFPGGPVRTARPGRASTRTRSFPTAPWGRPACSRPWPTWPAGTRTSTSRESATRKLIARLQEVGKLNNGKAINYALGVDVGEYRGLKCVEHSRLGRRLPVHPSPVPDGAVLHHPPGQRGRLRRELLARRVADLYLDGQVQARPGQRRQAVRPERKEVKVNPALFDAYAGEYRVIPGISLTVAKEGGRLTAVAPGARRAFSRRRRSESSSSAGEDIDDHVRQAGRRPVPVDHAHVPGPAPSGQARRAPESDRQAGGGVRRQLPQRRTRSDLHDHSSRQPADGSPSARRVRTPARRGRRVRGQRSHRQGDVHSRRWGPDHGLQDRWVESPARCASIAWNSSRRSSEGIDAGPQ